MDEMVKKLMREVSDVQIQPGEAYNIRNNGKSEARFSTENIRIVSKEDVSGLDIYIKPFTKHESVHIPALITTEGIDEVVYNDFHIGEGADVVIVAGCGINNCGCKDSIHAGIHRFFLGKDSKVLYLEKHIGEGDGTGERIINPETHVEAGPGSYMEMNTVQLGGVDSTKRVSSATLAEGATLIIKEKIMTHGKQTAETSFDVVLEGADSSAQLVSRSVAKEQSKQLFRSSITGNNACYGHSECDAIIMDEASVAAQPEIYANHVDASLIHEAAIGKIAGEQLMKLMTLGLTEAEAEEQIINGFLK